MGLRAVESESICHRAHGAAISAAAGYVVSESVSKTYGEPPNAVEALAAVGLKIDGGTFTAIVGPSGCGKSTLMLLVAGLLRPTSGRIFVAGREVSGPVTDVGIVFQDPTLLEWRTVFDNVLLQIDIRRLARPAYTEAAHHLLRSVGLDHFARRYPRELSGGMRQRAALCRALIHDPPLLLMDEPFGALDALTRERLASDLQRLWYERQKTVLFITHSISEAVFLADRVVVMSPRPGRVLDSLDVNLPRPRAWDIQQSKLFLEYTMAIRETFERAGVL
jgi:NitT/TauT family transport system ATP-binding protein